MICRFDIILEDVIDLVGIESADSAEMGSRDLYTAHGSNNLRLRVICMKPNG